MSSTNSSSFFDYPMSFRAQEGAQQQPQQQQQQQNPSLDDQDDDNFDTPRAPEASYSPEIEANSPPQTSENLTSSFQGMHVDESDDENPEPPSHRQYGDNRQLTSSDAPGQNAASQMSVEHQDPEPNPGYLHQRQSSMDSFHSNPDQNAPAMMQNKKPDAFFPPSSPEAAKSNPAGNQHRADDRDAGQQSYTNLSKTQSPPANIWGGQYGATAQRAGSLDDSAAENTLSRQDSHTSLQGSDKSSGPARQPGAIGHGRPTPTGSDKASFPPPSNVSQANIPQNIAQQQQKDRDYQSLTDHLADVSYGPMQPPAKPSSAAGSVGSESGYTQYQTGFSPVIDKRTSILTGTPPLHERFHGKTGSPAGSAFSSGTPPLAHKVGQKGSFTATPPLNPSTPPYAAPSSANAPVNHQQNASMGMFPPSASSGPPPSAWARQQHIAQTQTIEDEMAAEQVLRDLVSPMPDSQFGRRHLLPSAPSCPPNEQQQQSQSHPGSSHQIRPQHWAGSLSHITMGTGIGFGNTPRNPPSQNPSGLNGSIQKQDDKQMAANRPRIGSGTSTAPMAGIGHHASGNQLAPQKIEVPRPPSILNNPDDPIPIEYRPTDRSAGSGKSTSTPTSMTTGLSSSQKSTSVPQNGLGLNYTRDTPQQGQAYQRPPATGQAGSTAFSNPNVNSPGLNPAINPARFAPFQSSPTTQPQQANTAYAANPVGGGSTREAVMRGQWSAGTAATISTRKRDTGSDVASQFSPQNFYGPGQHTTAPIAPNVANPAPSRAPELLPNDPRSIQMRQQEELRQQQQRYELQARLASQGRAPAPYSDGAGQYQQQSSLPGALQNQNGYQTLAAQQRTSFYDARAPIQSQASMERQAQRPSAVPLASQSSTQNWAQQQQMQQQMQAAQQAQQQGQLQMQAQHLTGPRPYSEPAVPQASNLSGVQSNNGHQGLSHQQPTSYLQMSSQKVDTSPEAQQPQGPQHRHTDPETQTLHTLETRSVGKDEVNKLLTRMYPNLTSNHLNSLHRFASHLSEDSAAADRAQRLSAVLSSPGYTPEDQAHVDKEMLSLGDKRMRSWSEWVKMEDTERQREIRILTPSTSNMSNISVSNMSGRLSGGSESSAVLVDRMPPIDMSGGKQTGGYPRDTDTLSPTDHGDSSFSPRPYDTASSSIQSLPPPPRLSDLDPSQQQEGSFPPGEQPAMVELKRKDFPVPFPALDAPPQSPSPTPTHIAVANAPKVDIELQMPRPMPGVPANRIDPSANRQQQQENDGTGDDYEYGKPGATPYPFPFPKRAETAAANVARRDRPDIDLKALVMAVNYFNRGKNNQDGPNAGADIPPFLHEASAALETANNSPSLETYLAEARNQLDFKSNQLQVNFSHDSQARRQQHQTSWNAMMNTGRVTMNDFDRSKNEFEMEERRLKIELDKDLYLIFERDYIETAYRDVKGQLGELGTKWYEDVKSWLLRTVQNLNSTAPEFAELGTSLEYHLVIEAIDLLNKLHISMEEHETVLQNLVSDRNSRYLQVSIAPLLATGDSARAQDAEKRFWIDEQQRHLGTRNDTVKRASDHVSIVQKIVQGVVRGLKKRFGEVMEGIYSALFQLPTGVSLGVMRRFFDDRNNTPLKHEGEYTVPADMITLLADGVHTLQEIHGLVKLALDFQNAPQRSLYEASCALTILENHVQSAGVTSPAQTEAAVSQGLQQVLPAQLKRLAEEQHTREMNMQEESADALKRVRNFVGTLEKDSRLPIMAQGGAPEDRQWENVLHPAVEDQANKNAWNQQQMGHGSQGGMQQGHGGNIPTGHQQQYQQQQGLPPMGMNLPQQQQQQMMQQNQNAYAAQQSFHQAGNTGQGQGIWNNQFT